jgi:hypothetical protein
VPGTAQYCVISLNKYKFVLHDASPLPQLLTFT